MSDLYTIFVVDNSIDEDAHEHYEVVQWSYRNLKSQNVIAITAAQILELGKMGVLDVIAELNESIIGEGEDDWIIDNEIKLEVLRYLENNFNSKSELVDKIKTLLDYAIKHERNIYFHF